MLCSSGSAPDAGEEELILSLISSILLQKSSRNSWAIKDEQLSLATVTKINLGLCLLLLIKFTKYAALAVDSAHVYFWTHWCHWRYRTSDFDLRHLRSKACFSAHVSSMNHGVDLFDCLSLVVRGAAELRRLDRSVLKSLVQFSTEPIADGWVRLVVCSCWFNATWFVPRVHYAGLNVTRPEGEIGKYKSIPHHHRGEVQFLGR